MRGINVSGQKLIKMVELKTLYEGLNFVDVKTYIQSGNVVFKAQEPKTKNLENLIQKNIQECFGFDVPVMVLSKEQWEVVQQNNPFITDRKVHENRLYVTFLSDEPSYKALEKTQQSEHGVDEYIVSGKVIYLFCPDGYGNTKLSNTFFENKLKLTATTRNWNTINKLMWMANENEQ